MRFRQAASTSTFVSICFASVISGSYVHTLPVSLFDFCDMVPNISLLGSFSSFESAMERFGPRLSNILKKLITRVFDAQRFKHGIIPEHTYPCPHAQHMYAIEVN